MWKHDCWPHQATLLYPQAHELPRPVVCSNGAAVVERAHHACIDRPAMIPRCRIALAECKNRQMSHRCVSVECYLLPVFLDINGFQFIKRPRIGKAEAAHLSATK